MMANILESLIRGRRFILLCLLLLQVAPVFGGEYVYPLKQGADNRLLVDQNEKPFFWSGDAAWSLLAQVNLADAIAYLDDRAARGVNVIVVDLIEHKFTDNAPANFYGQAPFTGSVFTTPNESFFAHVDAVIEAAATRGIILLLHPLYLGYSGTDEGWSAEVDSAPTSALTTWGQYVGNRYKDYDNIIWSIGGDRDPTALKPKVQAMVDGLRQYDTRHLFTAHNEAESYAISHWPGATWLNINNIYSYSATIYQQAKTAYDLTPVMPFFMTESTFENEHSSTRQQVRAEAYYPVLGGAIGYNFGASPIWNFNAAAATSFADRPLTWQTALSSGGSQDMDYCQRLFRSRAWYDLVPDWTHLAMTAGYGTWGDTDYAPAALTANGNTLMAYLPTRRQVTVSMSHLSGTTAKCYWYNPSTGTATLIGTYATSGNQQFTPPASGDWALVIDDASLNLTVPGVIPTPTPTPTPTPLPPTQPSGQLCIGYTLTTPSTGNAGETVTYTYHWTSDQGDDVSHGPKPETFDMLTEMDLVQAGEIWTLTVTPHCEGVDGTPSTARIRILYTEPENGIVSWVFYH